MNKTTLQEMSDIAQKIVDDREWDQFHTIKGLVMNLVQESSELMEPFIWLSDQESADLLSSKKRQDIEEEVGDVFLSLLMICNKTNINLKDAFLKKMVKIEKKYPVEKCKGRNVKYTEL
jgi:NTP pyrophosphatase (non-canonical NTP hydrolase)